jgi:hypothetical protein
MNFVIVGTTLIFPFTLLGDLSGFVPPPISVLLLMAIIAMLYIILAELVKKSFTSA